MNTCVPCRVLHRPGKTWNRGGTFHQRLLKLREACSSTVGRLGACKSEEKNSVLSVQCGEEICQSVYSSHSSAWKRDLLKENLEMQLLRQKKKKKRGREGKKRKKTKPKRNQTKKNITEPLITTSHLFKMWVFSTWQPIFQGYTAAQGRIGSGATRREVSGPGCSEKREKRKEKMTGKNGRASNTLHLMPPHGCKCRGNLAPITRMEGCC